MERKPAVKSRLDPNSLLELFRLTGLSNHLN
jgi:hypothetical protein